MLRSFVLPPLLLTLSLAVACSDDAAEMRQNASKAQADANVKIDAANATADQTIRTAQADADSKIAAERAKFTALREDYRHKVTLNLVDLDKKIADADAKASKSTGKTKAQIDARLVAVHADRDAFARDFATLDQESSATWDAATARMDLEWKNLVARVDEAAG